MANGIQFPLIQPSSRSYQPGERPRTTFQSQNGSTTLIEFGTQQVNAELRLEFKNITDDLAMEIINHYNSIVEDEWVKFTRNRGYGGMSEGLYNVVENGSDKLRWRYDGPPEIRSVYPGVSTVACKFIGYFYGA